MSLPTIPIGTTLPMIMVLLVVVAVDHSIHNKLLQIVEIVVAFETLMSMLFDHFHFGTCLIVNFVEDTVVVEASTLNHCFDDLVVSADNSFDSIGFPLFARNRNNWNILFDSIDSNIVVVAVADKIAIGTVVVVVGVEAVEIVPSNMLDSIVVVAAVVVEVVDEDWTFLNKNSQINNMKIIEIIVCLPVE